MKLSLLPVASLALVLTAFACTTTVTRTQTDDPDASTTGDGGSSDTDAATSPKDGSSTPSGKDAQPSTPGSADKCSGQSSMQACQQCCAQEEQSAYGAFQNALLACGCKEGVCKTQCATTLCAATPQNPSAECQTCLGQSQSGACRADMEKVCGAGGACAPFSQCVESGCAGKR